MKSLRNFINKIKKNIFANKYLENSVIGQKLLKGIFWSVGGTVFSRALTMISAIGVARLMGVNEYGKYGMINSTIIMFSTFAGLGLGSTATKFIAEYKENNKYKAGKIYSMINVVGILSGSIMCLVLYLLSDIIANNQFNQVDMTSSLKIASILLITNTFNAIQISTLSGLENFKVIAKNSIIQGIIAAPLFLVFAFLWKCQGLIIANVILSIVVLIIYSISIKKTLNKYCIRPYYAKIFEEKHILWKFSIPSMLSGIMIGPVVWVANTIIINTQNGYFELGLFNAADQWRNIMIFLPQAIGNVLLPLIVANKDNPKLEKINILGGWFIVLVFCIPLMAYPNIISSFYGDKYNGESFYITISLILMMCCILSYKEGIARKLVSKNLMWFGFFSNSLWGATFLIVVYNLKHLGAIGLAIGYITSYVLTTIIFIPFYIRKNIISRELIISKNIVCIWGIIILQNVILFISDNYILKSAIMALGLFIVYKTITDMFLKSDEVRKNVCNRESC